MHLQRFLALTIAALTAATASNALAQTWNGGGGDDNWGTGANWGGSAPTPSSTTDIQFAGSTRLTPNNNYTAFDDFRNVLFNSGAGAFTISGSAIDLFGKVENNSTNLQTFNLSLGINTSFIEVNPVSGDLTIGSPNIFLGANQLRVYGNNAKTLTFTSGSIISGTSGTLSLNQNSTVAFNSAHTYTGDTFINAGTLQINSGGSASSSTIRLGDTIANSPAATLSLASGATISSLFNTRASASGTQGTRTIASTAATGTATASGNIYLDADATVTSASGGTFAFTGSTFDLKNQTLTVSGAGNTTISGVLTNSTGNGNVTMNGAGTLTLTGTNTFTGNLTNSAGGVTIGGSGALGAGSYAGNISAAGTFTYNSSFNQTLSGVLSGAGTLNKTNSGTLTLSNNNTFTGAITLGAGTIVARHVSALGTTAGTVTFAGTAGTPTLNLQTGGSDTAKNISLGSGAIGSTLASDVLTGSVGINHTLGTLSIGNATLNITKGANVLSGSPSITFGTVNLSAGSAGTAIVNPTTADLSLGAVSIGVNSFAKTLQLDGTSTNNTITGILANGLVGPVSITKANTSTWTLSGANTYSSNTTVTLGTLNMSGSLSSGAGAISVNPASGNSATLTLSGSGSFARTGQLIVGNTAGGTGIMNVNGTATYTAAAGTAAILIGNAGFGTYNQTGGTVTSGQFLVAGIGSGTGIMNISGGTFNPKTGNNGGTVGATATTSVGQLNMTGTGSYVSTDVGTLAGIFIGENGIGTLNISGSATMTLGGASTSAGLKIGAVNVATAIGNVNLGAVGAGGGTITAVRVQTGGTTAKSTLNFHGGTLKASTGASATFMTGLTASYVYPEGGIIDNNNVAITIAQPLLAPTGSGVTAISPSATGFTTTGYSTAPLVTFSGGTFTASQGAAAVATVDGSGNLTAITIVNPGVYSSVSGLTATLSGGGKSTTSATTVITTAANSSGGLTFTGTGTTTMSGASTYSGNITVTNGTLAAGLAIVGNPTAAAFGNEQVGGRKITALPGSTINLTVNDIFGNGAATPSLLPSVTLSNATMTSVRYNQLGPITLASGSTLTQTNVTDTGNYQQYHFLGTVSVTGTGASTITSGNGKANHLSANTTFDVADVTGDANSDLLVNAALNNGSGNYALAAGGYTKIGAGTMALSVANAYTGNTTISNGTLRLTGSGSIATSTNLFIAAGATLDASAISFSLASIQVLKGNGTLRGNVATAAGSSIQPGASAGTLTVVGNLDLSSASVIFELSTNYNTGNDQIIVGTNLTLNSSTTLRISALSGASNLDTNADYVLFSVGGATTMATQPTLIWDGTTPANYLNYSLVQTNNNVVLRYSAATSPTLAASALPSPAARNQAFTITAVVTNGIPGSVVSVTVDLSQVGGSGAASLVLSNNNIWTNTFTVSAGTTIGTKSLTVSATDNTTPTPLVGAYVITPFAVVANSQTWDGGAANDNTTSGTNWISDYAPGLVGDSMTFAGTTRLTPNLNTNYTVSAVTFDNTAGSFAIGSANASVLTLDNAGSLTLNSGVANNQTINVTLGLSSAANATATIANNSSSLLTIASNITANVASGNGALTVSGAGNTTVTGSVTNAGAGSEALLKTGTGKLTLSGGSTWSGSGALGRIPAPSAGFPLVAREGTLLLNGGTHSVTGELVIGGVVADGGAGQNANLTVDGSTLNLTSWLSVGRGNGVGGVSSDLVLTNAAVVSAGNFSAGFSGSGAANLPKGSITLYSNSTLTITGNGAFQLGESPGADMTLNVNNSAQVIATGTGFKTLGQTGKGTVNLNDSATINFGNATTYIGYRTGTGVVNMATGTLFRNAGELRVGGSDLSGTGINGTGAFTMSGGTAELGALTVARGNNNQNGVSGTVTVSGGALTSTNDIILGFAGANNLGKLTISGGTVNLGPAASKWLMLGQFDTSKGQLDITSGSLNLMNSTAIKFTTGNTGTSSTNVINQSGGSVTYYSDNGVTVGGTGDLDLARSGAATCTNTYNLNGGTLTVPTILSLTTLPTRIFNFNGGTLRPTANNATFMNLGTGNARANVRDGGAKIDSNGKDITIAQALVHSDISGDAATDGGLTKTGTGTLALNGINTYTGITTVSNGTLGGTGTIAGSIVVVSGATLAPGTSIGTLTGGNGATLGGMFLAEINRTNAQTADKFNATGGTVTFGGTLTITNIGQSLVVGDTFDLFDGTLSGTFSTLNLPNGTVHWITGDLNAGGTIAFTNNSPVAQNLTAGVVHGGTVVLPVIGGKNSATDADGDNLSVTAVGTPTSGSASFGASNVTYVASGSTGTNTFTYTVTDALGATDTKTVTVIVTDPQGFNQLNAQILGPDVVLTYLGIPGTNYALDRTFNLTPPVTWVPQITNPAAGNGYLIFTNTPDPSTNNFWRTSYVP